MSLRLRLSLLYMGVLSGVILLLGILVYALFRWVLLVNPMDGHLFQASQPGLQSFWLMFTLVGLITLVLSGFGAWVITGKSLAPLETFSQLPNQVISSDDFSSRIPLSPSGSDEIDELARAFNQTLMRFEGVKDAQSRFLADVNHELRTPLTVIKGNVGLMRKVKAFDTQSLNSIESEVDRLIRLVEDMLFVSQAEAGDLPLLLDSVDMGALLQEVGEQLRASSNENHDVVLESLEKVSLLGDRNRLKQVFLDLGNNAINYSPEGGKITLGMAVNGDWVEVTVKDEGIGIPKEVQRRLFECFYRGDESRGRTRKETGFGLSLPIAYWIVRNHGGRIEVHSEAGRGSTFAVQLPTNQENISGRTRHLA